jgi:hypothetical protein
MSTSHPLPVSPSFEGWSVRTTVVRAPDRADDRLEVELRPATQPGLDPPSSIRYGVYRNGPGWQPLEVTHADPSPTNGRALAAWWDRFGEHPEVWLYRVLDAVDAMPLRRRPELAEVCAAETGRRGRPVAAAAALDRAAAGGLITADPQGRYQITPAGEDRLRPPTPHRLGEAEYHRWATSSPAAAAFPKPAAVVPGAAPAPAPGLPVIGGADRRRSDR